ncbi:MAG: acyltransferase family protein [Deltaproteobacteria bacterium]|nr:acyltransferase family protein [Deltaproteobacteria bacterium]
MSAKKEIPNKEVFSAQRLLKQLSDELDSYFNNPESFDRKRLEKMAVEFIEELKLISSNIPSLNIPSLKNLSESASPGKIWEIIGKVRRVLQSDEVDEYGCDRQFEMAIKPFFDFLFQKYFRVSVQGIENIPSTGRALLVANHSGVLPYDAAMMKVAIYNEHAQKRELRFLVDDFVFHFPFMGVMMNRIGGIRACPENAERLLNQGELVSVFPEGIKGISKPFTERYKLQRFGRGGAIRLALNTQAPIVPVAIVGAEEIHPLLYKSSVLARPLGLPFIPITPTFPFLGPLGAIPLPTKWTMVFGKPIPFDQYSEKDRHNGILINRENEKLREQIQEMVFDVLKDRKSVFFG